MMATDKLLRLIDKSNEIDEVLSQVPDLNFEIYLSSLMDDLNISKATLLDRTDIGENDYYQFYNGEKIPNRNQVIQLAIGLQIGLKETNNLLSLSHNRSLHPKEERDAIIIISLKHHYPLSKANSLLYDYHYETLK